MTKNKIGLISATFFGISSIIGSGWLFAPYRSAAIAGPAAILAWIVGAGLLLLLALCLAEIASLYPRRGLTAIIPTLSHNKYFGFPFAVANWLGVVTVVGLEADATIQYLINLFPHLKPYFFMHDQLTLMGDFLSIILVIFYGIINYWGAKSLVKANNILVVLKILIPVITSLVIIGIAFHPKNFTLVGHSFVPYGAQSILISLLSSGIIIAFNGFQSIVSFASEIKKPHKTIPLSLILSIVICLAVYLLLQVAFIGGVPTKMLAAGWHQLSFSAPMVELSLMLGLGLLASMVYFGAVVAPFGTAITFTGSATRMFTAMSRNQQMPKYFDKVHPTYGISRRSLVMNTILAILFLLFFRSWGQLAQVLSLLHVVSYLPIPIALCVFRKHLQPKQYPFRVPGGKAIALFIFIVFSYLLAIGDFEIVALTVATFILFQVIFIALNVKTWEELKSSFNQCYLLLTYFVGIAGLNYLSPQHFANFSQDIYVPIVVLFSALFFYVFTRQERDDAELLDLTVNYYRNDVLE